MPTTPKISSSSNKKILLLLPPLLIDSLSNHSPPFPVTTWSTFLLAAAPRAIPLLWILQTTSHCLSYISWWLATLEFCTILSRGFIFGFWFLFFGFRINQVRLGFYLAIQYFLHKILHSHLENFLRKKCHSLLRLEFELSQGKFHRDLFDLSFLHFIFLEQP